MWRSCKRYPSFNSSLRFYQANSGPVCFSVGFDFERKKQVNPAKLLAFHARCPAAGHGISGSYNVQPQNREKRAPSRLMLMRTALFWYSVPNKALDENKQLILAILQNQNLGNLAECAQYVSS